VRDSRIGERGYLRKEIASGFLKREVDSVARSDILQDAYTYHMKVGWVGKSRKQYSVKKRAGKR
jgi:hypothetical protein